MKRLVKVCGMTQGDNIRAVEELGVDLIGLIFYPKSPRCLCSLPDYLPQRARRVGVFVNETKENVLTYADRFGLHYIQLHGNESPGYCLSLRRSGLRLIKAFPVSMAKDLTCVPDYEGLCDYFLFDTRTTVYGGSGTPFDWELLQGYRGHTPFLLSGGLHSGSFPALSRFSHPQWAGIDLNSRFEITPGVKDTRRLEIFLQILKQNNF